MEPSLRVVLDEEFFPPAPEPRAVVADWQRSWLLDQQIAASVNQPGPLLLVTGI